MLFRVVYLLFTICITALFIFVEIKLWEGASYLQLLNLGFKLFSHCLCFSLRFEFFSSVEEYLIDVSSIVSEPTYRGL